MCSDEIILAGECIDTGSLRDAEVMLQTLVTMEPPAGLDTPPWLPAALAATQQALRDAESNGEPHSFYPEESHE